ncbi:MAG: carbohydrate ABC transporter permease [Chloroflexota bacterium]|nr:MAG: carbohydrate ABC transporter permease [Chloroflexota bacterium]
MAVTAKEHELQKVSPSTRLGVNTLLLFLGKLVVYALLIAGAILFTAPWAWMLSASFQPLGDIFNWPPTWWPEHFTLENYRRVLRAAGIGRWYVNSAFIAFSVVVLQIFFNSLAAYTFAKRRFPGRDAIFVFMLGTLMIPGVVFLIPNYVILQHIPLFGENNILGQGGIGWLDSFWGLIVPSAVSVWGIFFIRQYMKSIPDELLDAARIDGATEFRIYWQIALPLSGPALAATAISTFTWNWNDFFWPMLVISNPDLRTVQLGLALFVVQNRTVWDVVMSGSVLATLPVLIVFLIFQRYFIRGIALTGMK